MTEMTCPSCGDALEVTTEAVLPEQTDITLTLQITPGLLCMAKTIAGVIDSFVDLQVEVGKSLDCDVSVFMAGLRYEDDVIYLTFRIANAVRGRTSASVDTRPEGGDASEIAAPFTSGAVPEGQTPKGGSHAPNH